MKIVFQSNIIRVENNRQTMYKNKARNQKNILLHYTNIHMYVYGDTDCSTIVVILVRWF